MVTHITRVWINRVSKVASPARGQLNRETEYFPVRVRAWEFGLARRVWPSRPASACSFSILRLNLVFTHGISLDFRVDVHLFIYHRHTPSGQSRVYRITQSRTDGVHCRESAGTGPVNIKVVPYECCLGRSPWTAINIRLSFPHPLLV